MAATHFSGPVISAAGFQSGEVGAAGAQNLAMVRRTGLPDAAPTAVIAITVPNGNHSAAIFLDIMAHPVTAGTDANTSDSVRVASGVVAVTRHINAATVATAVALILAGIATSGTATIALAYGVSSVAGANNATQTLSITLTITQTGGTISSHTAVIFARLMNSADGGVTMVGL